LLQACYSYHIFVSILYEIAGRETENIGIRFMKEVLREIIISIKEHKARSILTGFGIAWGMFILIVLLGAGNGFRNGMLAMFSGYASNSIWVTGQWVSQASIGGIQSGSRVRFNESIAEKLQKRWSWLKSDEMLYLCRKKDET
jgi:hypothetical protein